MHKPEIEKKPDQQAEQIFVSHLPQLDTSHIQHLAVIISAKVPSGQLRESTQPRLEVKKKPDQQAEQILVSHLLQLDTSHVQHLAELLSAKVPSGQL